MRQKNIFKKEFLELTGCIHIHSEHSYDCEIPLAKIIKNAKQTELDFITINDHRNFGAKKDEVFLAEKDLCVIVGTEINDPENNNHLLVFNSEKIRENEDAVVYTKSYQAENAITFAAHPIEKRRSNKYRFYRWTDLENDNFNGLEIWNFLSSWIGKLMPKINGIFYVLCPAFFVRKPHREALNYWDKLNNEGKKRVAIGSIDAHTETIKILGKKIRIVTHKMLFKTLRTNVLISKNAEISENSILKAIKNGNSYIVNHKVGNPYDFYAAISNGQDKSAIFGENIQFENGLKFYFRLPKIARINLFQNGKKIASQLDEKGFFEIDKSGNYRLEITYFGFGWIYTNNIYVKEKL
ncbi:MAG: PHP domain-containing protein [Candidatus Cloacimonetes bacterium]|nr:PHP domain-containing protein [Candidatus Cloacimonadota bacterium]